MSFLHDTIKINLIRQGYLSNYPYHMISDSEMCDAFLSESNTGFFFDNYPLLDKELEKPYNDLVSAIRYYINQLKSPHSDDYVFPDWVYSYMLGSTISVNSDAYDIQYLADMLNIDIDYGDFSALLSLNCYRISKEWLRKLPQTESQMLDDSNIDTRPPTIFGEPHVVKYLRLLNVSI